MTKAENRAAAHMHDWLTSPGLSRLNERSADFCNKQGGGLLAYVANHLFIAIIVSGTLLLLAAAILMVFFR
jgi:hypothetical protein